ncbi:MAG: hypothetical protein KKB37_10060 [Alphaproteobacteria bacterium]|nr:hypothetical protein [Alphaproteobacteria bacterium]
MNVLAVVAGMLFGVAGGLALVMAGTWLFVIWMDDGRFEGGEPSLIAVFALLGVVLLWAASSMGVGA